MSTHVTQLLKAPNSKYRNFLLTMLKKVCAPLWKPTSDHLKCLVGLKITLVNYAKEKKKK